MMDLHLYGRNTSSLNIHVYMKVKFISFLFLVIFFSCNKEDCYTITEKRIIDGKYYFYFDAQENYNLTQNNLPNQGGVYLDEFASGQVDKETYESTNVGDKYCN
ncbi:MAG: hypothetical protein H8E55_57985 [Pelagibacterales bacterium]|nr:hypothetical protein [Pelagibacterales bacterium]